ncbi:MAG: response regulator transcription factor [Candidatus Mcinerneyibacterium aminivorans]|uniref:Response regulator transcription factor n=1 Tax=Candidatus Mcinerneyibacterium aminivorans TaxID=2703815 RepID=A0A5D0MBW7_9BACT|nr:MAG: response regulator transcription factor [Candidatus Mcinerneyibacterium aminivorans]
MLEHIYLFAYIISIILGFGIYIRLLSQYKTYKFSVVYYLKKYIILFVFLILVYFIKNYISINLVYLNKYDYFVYIRIFLFYMIFLLHYIMAYYLFKAYNFLHRTEIDKTISYIIGILFIFMNIFLLKEIVITIETRSIYGFIKYIEYSILFIYFIIVFNSIWKIVSYQKNEKRKSILTKGYFIFFMFYYLFYAVCFIFEKDLKSILFLLHNLVFLLGTSYFFVNYFNKKELIEIHEKKLFENLKSHGITDREWDIINLIVKGNTNKEIAKKLFISIKTVKHHIYHIFKKLNVRNRIELINYIYEFKKINQP